MNIKKGYKKLKKDWGVGMKTAKGMVDKSAYYGNKLTGGLNNYFEMDRMKAKDCLGGKKC